jgi:Spy/CpxP family protein refolding chaperone
MSDAVKKPEDQVTSTPDRTRRCRHRGRRLIVGVLVIAASVGAGAWFATAQPMRHGHGQGMTGGMHGANFTMQDASDWAEFMSRRMLRQVDATPEQRTKIAAIIDTAVKELYPAQEQMRASRDQAIKLLSAPTIDRGAVEKLRAEHAATHDRLSKRVAQSLTEIAENLTPEQREKLAKLAAERHAHR